jgi:hypothetical protein
MESSAGRFGGDLGVVGLFDLGQLLMLNRATGCLSVECDGRRGYFYFDSGQIVNAVDENFQEGEAAAYRMFTWRKGLFEFKPEAPSGSRLIAESTEAVMLEAARHMDESTPAAGESAERRLVERRDSMEALRETFRSLASEVHSGPPLRVSVDEGLLDALREPSDRLMVRAGRPARLRCAGSWFNASESAMTPEDIAALEARWPNSPAAASDPAAQHAAAPEGTRVVRLAQGGVYAVTSFGHGAERTLWARPLGGAHAGPAGGTLSGALDALAALIAEPHALIVIAAHDADAADHLLHLVIGFAARRDCGAVALFAEGSSADAGAATPPDESGVVVRLPSEAATRLDALRPDALALGAGGVPTGLSPSTLARVSLVFHAVAGDSASALARWRLAWADRVSEADAYLESVAIGIVTTGPMPGDDGEIEIDVTRVPRRGASRAKSAA